MKILSPNNKQSLVPKITYCTHSQISTLVAATTSFENKTSRSHLLEIKNSFFAKNADSASKTFMKI